MPFDEGQYLFTITPDDGMRVSVDGTMVLSAWYDQAAHNYTKVVPLSKGQHKIQVEYYEHGGLAQAKFMYKKVDSDTSRACSHINGVSYKKYDVQSPVTDRPASVHADLNLELRGYKRVNQPKTYQNYTGTTDGNSPNLRWLFADKRVPVITGTYKVYDWNWQDNVRGQLLTNWPVTHIDVQTDDGEIIYVPSSGYDLGGGYEVLVLYADDDKQRITLKYTNNDNVVRGYTLHIDRICIDPELFSLYQQLDTNGRNYLPALSAGQAIGYAAGNHVGVSIVDSGQFMDPRSKKDWWK